MIIRWKWHTMTGYREFQRQAAVVALLADAGRRIADAAGGEEAGFEVDVHVSAGARDVPRVAVIAASFEAKQAEAKNRTLTRALDAGR